MKQSAKSPAFEEALKTVSDALDTLGSDGLLLLAQADEAAGARDLLALVRKRLAAERDEIESHPVRSDDYRKDAGCRLRYCAALQWILNLPHAAKAIIKNQTGG